MTLRVQQIELSDAAAFIAEHHRHNKRIVGHRFSVGCALDGRLVGVAVVGRPVARASDKRMTLEVLRLCTTGERGVCSFLYARCARIGAELGYARIQSFILADEPGTSLKAAGWTFDGMTTSAVGGWGSRPGRNVTAHVQGPKQRWVRQLGPCATAGGER